MGQWLANPCSGSEYNILSLFTSHLAIFLGLFYWFKFLNLTLRSQEGKVSEISSQGFTMFTVSHTVPVNAFQKQNILASSNSQMADRVEDSVT